jgi:hypothetical protein
MRDDRPAAPASSLVIPASAAPSSTPPPLQASTALPLVTSDPPAKSSVKIIAPPIAKSAKPQPSARPTATVNEDDIK